MKAITSADNTSFKRWRRLAESPRDVRRSGRTLAEGVHLAQAVFEAGHPVESVLARRGGIGREARRWIDRFSAAGVAAYELPAALFDQISCVDHGAGVALVIPIAPAAPLAPDNTLFIDGVQDPGNTGALLRVAAAAGLRNVLAGVGSVSLWSPKVMRGAQGAHFRLNLREEVDAALLSELLPIPWVGAVAHGGEPLWGAPLEAPALGWVIGGEGAGISPAAAAACGRMVTIPVARGVESLNVAAAAAVCLFERNRRAFVSLPGTPASP